MENKLFDLGNILEGKYYSGTFLVGISKEFFSGMKYSDFSEEKMATFVHEYFEKYNGIDNNCIDTYKALRHFSALYFQGSRDAPFLCKW